MKRRTATSLFGVFFVAACAGPGSGGGFGSVAKTNQLAPGMSVEEVKVVLGDPSKTHFFSEKWVWTYSLHEYWRGSVPYYLIFSRDSQRLISWYADEAEYMRQQQLWLQAMPPVQNQKIEIQIKPGVR